MKKSLLALTLISAAINVAPSFAINRCLQQLDLRVKQHKLDLAYCQLQDSDIATVMDYLSRHQTIKSLDLTDNNITSDGVIQLSKQSQLYSLNLDGNQVSDAGAQALGNNKNLRNLNLLVNSITESGMIAFANNAEKTGVLTSLKMGELTDNVAAVLARIPSLTKLDSVNNHLTDHGILILANDYALSSLSIAYNDTPYSTDSALALANAENLHELNIYFDSNHPLFNEAELMAIAKADHFTSVSLDGVTAPVLYALANNPHITKLSISSNLLDGNSFTAFANNKQLKSLSVGINGSIPLQGVQAMASIPTLTDLIISAQIDDNSILELAKNKHIQSLMIDANLSDEAAALFAKNHTLQNFFFFGDNLSSQGLSAIASMPSLQTVAILDADGADEKSMQAFVNNKSITDLTLRYTDSINDATAMILAQRNFTYLDLSVDKIGDQGALALAKNNYAFLGLFYNYISDDAIKSIDNNLNILSYDAMEQRENNDNYRLKHTLAIKSQALVSAYCRYHEMQGDDMSMCDVIQKVALRNKK